MDSAERAEFRRRIEESRKGLKAAVSGLDPAQLSFKTAPDRWSIAECLEHIASTDATLFELIQNATPVETPPDNGDLEAAVLRAAHLRRRRVQAPESMRPAGRFSTPAEALATFERTIVSGETPFDRWVAGDEAAIGEPAKRGFALFTGKAQCAQCHEGWNFTGGAFYDIGEAADEDIGRGRIFSNSLKLQHAFKVPTLRDVARRAPYMHDGSVATLAEVIDLYDRGGIDRPSRSELIKPLGLDAREKADLVAFLETLTAAPASYAVPDLPR